MRSRPLTGSGGSSPSAQTLAPGTMLAGRYQIEKIIGTGGMSMVYAARDRRFRAIVRRCAVKEMFDNLTDPAARQRGLVEARLLSDWATIVGPHLAARCLPIRLSGGRDGGGGVLTVQCMSPSPLRIGHCMLLKKRSPNTMGFMTSAGMRSARRDTSG